MVHIIAGGQKIIKDLTASRSATRSLCSESGED